MEANAKDIAVRFLQLAASGKVDEAYDLYIDMSGTHHNVYFPAGFPALKQAMKDAHAQRPNKSLTPINVLRHGDLVAVHSRLVRASDAPDISVVHLFRMHHGKIVEMWDTGMEIPRDSPNADGAF